MPAAFTEKGKTWSGGKSSSLMLKFGYTCLAVSACALVLRASGYTAAASSAQELVVERPAGKRMDPFTKVVVCAPFNVKIVPDAEYQVAITADEVVKGAISTNVHQDTLSIEVTRGFRTSNPIQVTISLPHDQLQLVHNKAPKSTVAVGKGFSVRRFTGLNAGAATLHLQGLNAEEALLENAGCECHVTLPYWPYCL